MRWTHTPPHKVLTDTEAKRELKKVGIAYERLPLIEYSDAALKVLREEGIDTEVGKVVRITRNSKTYGEDFLYYRKIIP